MARKKGATPKGVSESTESTASAPEETTKRKAVLPPRTEPADSEPTKLDLRTQAVDHIVERAAKEHRDRIEAEGGEYVETAVTQPEETPLEEEAEEVPKKEEPPEDIETLMVEGVETKISKTKIFEAGKRRGGPSRL